METIEDAAIVVAGRDLGESDRLMTFISMRHGKVRAVAKGARRSRKRFLNALEPCTMLNIRVVPPRATGLGRLDGAEIVESYPAIRGSVKKFMLASLCCELADMWVQEEDPHSDIFGLLQWYLSTLSSNASGLMATLVFKTRILSMAGYRQVWDQCARCGARIQGGCINFSMKSGGCICESCGSDKGTGQHVAAGTLKSLAFIDNVQLSGISRLKMGRTAQNEAWQLLARLHCHHLRRAPMSYSVLGKIVSEEFR